MRDRDTGLSAEYLRSWVHYDRITGWFTWCKDQPNRTAKIGERAGWLDRKGGGHRKLQLPGFNRAFLEHRLAWLYVKGEWPKDQVDHKNRRKDQNHWSNLREANNSLNQANRGLRPHNKSGYTGITKTAQGNWLAECSVNKKRWRKVFKTAGEAVAARQSAVERMHREFAVHQ